MRLRLLMVLRRLLRPFRKLRTYFLAGLPSPFLPARLRQRLNLGFQEQRNLKTWTPLRYKPLEHSPAYFIHVPKNAGTSVSEALKQFAHFEEFHPRQNPKGNRLICVHYDTSWLLKQGILSETFLAEAYAFAFVRNPIDRALSTYRYYKREKAIPDGWSFLKFLTYVSRERPKLGGAHVARMSHAAPQSRWLSSANWAERLHVFKLENLSDASKEIGERMGVSLTVPHLNSTVREEVELTSREKNLLVNLYAEDFRLFDYPLPG